MTDTIDPQKLEVFESIRQRLRSMRTEYAERADADQYAELEDLARETYIALNRASKNLHALVEIERAYNARKRASGAHSEMTECHRILKEIHALPGISA